PRHPPQQRRHRIPPHAARDDRGRVGPRDGHRCQEHVSLDQGRRPRDGSARRRLRDLRVVGGRAARPWAHGLRGGEGRGDRLREDVRGPARPQRHPRERYRPRHGVDADGVRSRRRRARAPPQGLTARNGRQRLGRGLGRGLSRERRVALGDGPHVDHRRRRHRALSSLTRMTTPYDYITIDVFTDRPFGGNPLAVVTDARGLTTEQMQAIAAEFNYSESTFVLPPDDRAHTARVRIFTRTSEIPFAGHPNVGTAFALALRAEWNAQTVVSPVVFEEAAGLVPVELMRDPAGRVQGATLTAPQSPTIGDKVPAALVAACVGLDSSAVIASRHEPMHASVGLPFVIAEVAADALARATPNVGAFADAALRFPTRPGHFSLHL